MHEESKIIKVARYGGGGSGFWDIVMKNFALRIFYILLGLCVTGGCATTHVVGFLWVCIAGGA